MGSKTLKELEGEICSLRGRPNKNDCLVFICPCCKGGHSIIVSWLPPSLFSSGAVWKKTGETIDNITIHPSINCDVPNNDGSPSYCKFHGWVKSGVVTW